MFFFEIIVLTATISIRAYLSSGNSLVDGETVLNSISSMFRVTNWGNKKLLISRTLTNNGVNGMWTVPIEKSGSMRSLQCVLKTISSSDTPFSRNTATEMDAGRKLSVRRAILPSHLPFSISEMSILQGYLEPLRNMGDFDVLVVSAWSVCKSPCARIIPNLVIFGEKSWMGSLLYSVLHHGTNMNPAVTTRQDGTVGQGELLKVGVKETGRINNRQRLHLEARTISQENLSMILDFFFLFSDKLVMVSIVFLKPFDKQLMKAERTLQRKDAKSTEVRAETNRMGEEAAEMVEAMEEKEAELTGPNGSAEKPRELLKVGGEETGRRKHRKRLNSLLEKIKAKTVEMHRVREETMEIVAAAEEMKLDLDLLKISIFQLSHDMLHISGAVDNLAEITRLQLD
ncbi:hypothetical protein SLA2020_493550 [Shorea laevis]